MTAYDSTPQTCYGLWLYTFRRHFYYSFLLPILKSWIAIIVPDWYLHYTGILHYKIMLLKKTQWFCILSVSWENLICAFLNPDLLFPGAQILIPLAISSWDLLECPMGISNNASESEHPMPLLVPVLSAFPISKWHHQPFI